MALRESAALAVLARKANAMTFLQQRAERQRLTGGPIDSDATVDRLGPIFQEALDGAVNPEAVGHLGDLAADILATGDVDAGHASACVLFLIGVFQASPFAVKPVSLVRLIAGGRFELG